MLKLNDSIVYNLDLKKTNRKWETKKMFKEKVKFVYSEALIIPNVLNGKKFLYNLLYNR